MKIVKHDNQIRDRQKAVRKNMRHNGYDSLVVINPANVSYLTGFSGHDSWVLLVKNKVFLITDSRYTEQAEGECTCCAIICRKDTLVKETADILNRYSSVKTTGIESSVTISAYKLLSKALSAKLKPAKTMIESVREVKDSYEIKAVKKAAQIAWQALDASLKQLKSGISEFELAGLIDYQIRIAGAVNSFDTIVAFGANGSRPHHQPGNKRLKKIDTILIDFGARFNGYCSDMTRCFAIGKCRQTYQKAYQTVLQANREAIRRVKEGVNIAEIDKTARSIILSQNHPEYGHGTGHGLGLEVHEGPVVFGKSKARLKAGHIITIEPGVYIPGKLGIRIEDDVCVTSTGCSVLSKDSKYGFSEERLRVLLPI